MVVTYLWPNSGYRRAVSAASRLSTLLTKVERLYALRDRIGTDGCRSSFGVRLLLDHSSVKLSKSPPELD